MAIPQFDAEGVDQTGSGTITCSFTGFTFAANDILELVIATDGDVPVIATANGFAFAQDPLGNTASVTTNSGTAGAAECGIFVLWKRATGNTATTDPPPVFGARTGGGTVWALQPNSFSGARTSGTPYHVITTGIVTTATTAVTSVAATSTLANCLFMPRVASAEDDSAFNNWTMTGSASPSGTGAPNTGWHGGAGNACSFTGDEGGFAAAGGPRTATTTFATATKQALVTLVMASLPEAGIPSDDPGRSPTVQMPALVVPAPAPVAEEIPSTAATIIDDDAGGRLPVQQPLAWLPVSSVADEMPGTASGASMVDEDSLPLQPVYTTPPIVLIQPATDELQGSGSTATGFDEEVTPTAPPSWSTPPVLVRSIGADELPTPPGGSPSLGVSVWREKANTTAPTTGTLTTLASYPAWTPSTAYTVLLDARVANAGNAYEDATAGTSASSGGPTTTPAPVTGGAITDGSAAWNFLAAGNGAYNTQTSGSLFLVSLGRGADHSSGTAPRDSNGNTYSLIGSKTFFAGFPNSSASTWVSSLPATGSTGHTISADWGAGDDGGGDEISIMGVEVIGGTSVHDHSSIEATPVGNVCTSNPVTTTGPAVLVCFCWLNGGTHADGFLHVATPGSGFSMLALASGLLEIGNTAGQVQGCTIAKTVSSGGTYTATLTTAAGEGAVMHLIAIQGSALDPLSVFDDSTTPLLPLPLPRLVPSTPVSVEELAVAVPSDDDDSPWAWPQWVPVPVVVRAIEDELLAAAPVVIDEDSAIAPVPWNGPMLAARPANDEELPAPVVGPTMIDEDCVGLVVAAVSTPMVRLGAASEDEIPSPVATIVDEDAGWMVPSVAVARVVLAPVSEDELPRVALEDAPSWSFAVSWTAPAIPWRSADIEEMPGAAPPPPPGIIVDDDPSPLQVLYVAPSVVLAMYGAEDLPIAAVSVDPVTALEDAIHFWIRTGSGLDADHVIWSDAGNGGPTPIGLYISMRLLGFDSVSDDWLISRRAPDGSITHHVRGTRHPTLELTCSAGANYGANRAEFVLTRAAGAFRLPTVAARLQAGGVGVGAIGRVRTVEGRRSGMYDPKAIVEIPLHVVLDIFETGQAIESVEVETPAGTQTVVKP